MKTFFPEAEDVVDVAAGVAVELTRHDTEPLPIASVRVILETAFLRGWNAHTKVATEFMREYEALVRRNQSHGHGN